MESHLIALLLVSFFLGSMPTMVDAGVTMVTMANIESTEVQEVLGLNKTEAVR